MKRLPGAGSWNQPLKYSPEDFRLTKIKNDSYKINDGSKDTAPGALDITIGKGTENDPMEEVEDAFY